MECSVFFLTFKQLVMTGVHFVKHGRTWDASGGPMQMLVPAAAIW
jgi:hypothetical protein